MVGLAIAAMLVPDLLLSIQSIFGLMLVRYTGRQPALCTRQLEPTLASLQMPRP